MSDDSSRYALGILHLMLTALVCLTLVLMTWIVKDSLYQIVELLEALQ